MNSKYHLPFPRQQTTNPASRTGGSKIVYLLLFLDLFFFFFFFLAGGCLRAWRPLLRRSSRLAHGSLSISPLYFPKIPENCFFFFFLEWWGRKKKIKKPKAVKGHPGVCVYIEPLKKKVAPTTFFFSDWCFTAGELPTHNQPPLAILNSYKLLDCWPVVRGSRPLPGHQVGGDARASAGADVIDHRVDLTSPTKREKEPVHSLL